VGLTDEVRKSCSETARSARSVTIDLDALGRVEPAPAPQLDAERHYLEGSPEDVASYMLVLDSINFGSGWFPTLRKQPGMSGFRTVEAGLRARGPWTAEELAAVGRAEVAAALGQDPGHELMGLFETALRELGTKVRDGHGSSFLALARSQGSVEALAALLPAAALFVVVLALHTLAGAKASASALIVDTARTRR
jgi:hypothetical protein